jgi:hypothetical protein
MDVNEFPLLPHEIAEVDCCGIIMPGGLLHNAGGSVASFNG